MNWHAVRAIYHFEMARARRTVTQSIVSPVISTSLYFVVFGAAIGSRIQQIDGVSYGSFIVPGLIMLSLLTQSIANASFGIYSMVLTPAAPIQVSPSSVSTRITAPGTPSATASSTIAWSLSAGRWPA
jgi:ABC-2 type transport system permease protein